MEGVGVHLLIQLEEILDYYGYLGMSVAEGGVVAVDSQMIQGL